ncbi:serine/threonine-protein kinase [Pseudofrankia saprophytica]|uniref:serine/threonine-protein kinase n=1 Tax=Pseudofrankia saprophytica TaxID=298655 RepID=UPI000234CAD6|nr:serine/threonine-protein kinase [Pseudofrankia saprophytica]
MVTPTDGESLPRWRTPAPSAPLASPVSRAPGWLKPLAEHDPVQVGEYRVEGVLGRGGMGSVYLARAPSGPAVAIKVVRPDLAADPQFVRLFQREAQLARGVARFCTADVIDVGTADGVPYMVTEFINGPTLAEEVQLNGPFELPRLERLAIAVATALTAIHAAGTIHRDLKPSNVLLSADGPLVIDFGIAVALDGTAVPGEHDAGTPGYMAPEQARGERVGPAADIFAWGGVVAFAASGHPPFGIGPIHALLYRVVHEKPDLSGVPESLRALVTDAMNPDPDRRPTATQLYNLLVPNASPAADAAPPAPSESALALLGRSGGGSVQPLGSGGQPARAAGRRGADQNAEPAASPAPSPPVSLVPEAPPWRQPVDVPGDGQFAASTVTRLGGAPDRREATGRRPRLGTLTRPWWVVTGAVVLVAVMAAVILLLTSTGDDPAGPDGATPSASQPAGSTSQPTTPGTQSTRPSPSQPPEKAWETVLAGLDAARGRAFEQVDESALGDVYEAGSAVYAADLALLRQVARQGGHVSGLSLRVRDLQIREQTQDRVVLRVTEQLGAYEILDASGKVVLRKEQGAPERNDVTLVRTAAGWRISARLPAS